MVSRDRFSHPVPRQPAYSPHCESGAYSRDSFRFPRRRPFIYIPTTAIGSVPRLSGHAVAYRWLSLPRTRRHKACSPQASSSNASLCVYHGSILLAQLLYPKRSRKFSPSSLWWYCIAYYFAVFLSVYRIARMFGVFTVRFAEFSCHFTGTTGELQLYSFCTVVCMYGYHI